MKNLHTLNLCELTQAIRSGDITCADYTRACLTRIAQMEPQVQAWAWLAPERAMACAEQADVQRVAGLLAGKPLGLLHGIPVGIKDIFNTAGIPTAMGSPVFAGNIPGESAEAVSRLEGAGAFVMGKTVTAEFAFLTPGKTRNPWNPAHTPGGSSSGSAAAVAAGFVPAAIGTQTNGSVIRPAAFCGVVGFKPSQGLISNRGIWSFSPSLDQVGIFTRSVADAALLAAQLVENPHDLAAAIVPLNTAPRLAAVRSPVWHLATEAQQRRFAGNIAALSKAGALIEEIELPAAFGDAHRAVRTIMLFEAAHGQGFGELRSKHREALSPLLNDFLDQGEQVSETAYHAALALRGRLKEELNSFMQRFDAIITPPATGEAPRDLSSTGDASFCTIWSLTGAPAITIPAGLGPQGLPLGLQIVGAHLDDNRTLAVAQWCERLLESKSQ